MKLKRPTLIPSLTISQVVKKDMYIIVRLDVTRIIFENKCFLRSLN